MCVCVCVCVCVCSLLTYWWTLRLLPHMASVNNGAMNICVLVFSGGSDSKESTCNMGDLDSVLKLGRSPGEGNGNPLQYSCLESFTDRGAWWAIVMGSQRAWHDWATNTYLFKLVCFFQIYSQEWDLWVIWQFYFYFWRNVFHPAPIYIPTNSVQGSPFLHIFASICYL